MATSVAADHWHAHARQWSQIGGPLRPCHEDVALMAGWLGPQPGRGLLLGVTPELTALSAQLVAQDRDGAMIERLWRPRTPQQTAQHGDWLAPPGDPGQFDFAAGDGSLNVLAYAADYARLFERLRERVRDGGLVLLRVFCTPEPDQAETPAAVLEAARAGAIGSFHAFKWRLAMALVARQPQANPNIAVRAIHQHFDAVVPDRGQLAIAAGWPVADIDTIDVYRDSALTYSFPTRTALRAVLPDYCTEIGSASGTYELAERCPVIALRLRR